MESQVFSLGYEALQVSWSPYLSGTKRCSSFQVVQFPAECVDMYFFKNPLPKPYFYHVDDEMEA